MVAEWLIHCTDKIIMNTFNCNLKNKVFVRLVIIIQILKL